MRTVIFDLDGTLADTSGDLLAAANARFRALGHGDLLDPVADKGVAFRGARAMLRAGFGRLGTEDAGLVEREYPLLLDYYAAHIDRFTTLYPGAVAAVEMLRARGYATGICTNKPEAMAEDLMRKLGVRELFSSLIGADTLPVRKPDPAPYIEAVARAGGAVGKSMILGDTETDLKTARAIGVPCALVRFGPEGAGVEALAPDAVLERYADLAEVVAGLIG